MPIPNPPANGLPTFPHNYDTGFLAPNYGTKPKLRKKILLAVAEDGTRTGRIKSGAMWNYDLVWKGRRKAEFLTLTSFWETQGYHLGFNFWDNLREVWLVLYFDGDIDSEYVSYNKVDFTVSVVQ